MILINQYYWWLLSIIIVTFNHYCSSFFIIVYSSLIIIDILYNHYCQSLLSIESTPLSTSVKHFIIIVTIYYIISELPLPPRVPDVAVAVAAAVALALAVRKGKTVFSYMSQQNLPWTHSKNWHLQCFCSCPPEETYHSLTYDYWQPMPAAGWVDTTYIQ